MAVLTVLVSALGLLPTTVPPAAAAASPSVYPADVAYYYPTRGDSCVVGQVCTADPCPRGHFCASVFDPTRQDRKRFRFYRCRTYSLQSWWGNGGVVNNQSGNAVTRLYDRNGRLIRSVPANNLLYGVNWDSVWYIRVC